MLVVKSIFQAAALGELDDSLAFPRYIHVRIGHFTGRAEDAIEGLK